MSTRLHTLAICAIAAISGMGSSLAAQKPAKCAASSPSSRVLSIGESDRVFAWEALGEEDFASSMHELPLDQVVSTLTEGAVRFKARKVTTGTGISGQTPHINAVKRAKLSNASFDKNQGELLGVAPPASAAPAPMISHDEEWTGGSPHTIWIEFR